MTRPPRPRRSPRERDRSAPRRRGRGTRTAPCARRTSTRATGTPASCRTACRRSAAHPCARRPRRARAPDRRREREPRACPPPPPASAVRRSRRPAPRRGSPSQLLFQNVGAVQAAHVLPAHLRRLPHLLQRLRAPLGRVRVTLDDLVAPLAVHLVGLDVDGEELHLVVVEAVLARQRRQVALV